MAKEINLFTASVYKKRILGKIIFYDIDEVGLTIESGKLSIDLKKIDLDANFKLPDYGKISAGQIDIGLNGMRNGKI